MRILFLTNNPISVPLYLWLKNLGEDILIFQHRLTPLLVDELKVEFLISYNYRFIIPPEVLKLFPPCRRINLHISYLPYNRGAYPNVWSFLEDTPKGVTVHIMEPAVDSGDILLREEVPIDEEKHTLKSSYQLLHLKLQELFKKHWHQLKGCEIQPRPQEGGGTFHTVKEFEEKVLPLMEDWGWEIPIPLLKQRYFKKWKGVKTESA
jgi:methionyl-tRNA formyltransferase